MLTEFKKKHTFCFSAFLSHTILTFCRTGFTLALLTLLLYQSCATDAERSPGEAAG